MASKPATQRATVANGGAGKGEQSVVELATTWLEWKLTTSKVRDPYNSNEARTGDLCRTVRAMNLGKTSGPYDLGVELAGVQLRHFNPAAIKNARLRMESKYSSTTVARTMATVRGFVEWLVARGDIAGDEAWAPAMHTDREEHDPVGALLSTADVEALFAAGRAPNPRDWSAWPARDVAILAVLVGTGIRATDAGRLKVGDVCTAAPAQMTIDANNGTRTISLDRSTAATVSSYLEERAANAPVAPNEPLFVRREGGSLDRTFVKRLVLRCAAEAGVELPKGAAVHALRHYHGVDLARRGTPSAEIAARLGHADGRMAATYIRAAAAQGDDFDEAVAA